MIEITITVIEITIIIIFWTISLNDCPKKYLTII